MSTSAVPASAEDLESVLAPVDELLVREQLPAVGEVVPGYVAPGSRRPGLVVADFETESEDDLPWGIAVAAVLRDIAGYSPRATLYMPSPIYQIVGNDAFELKHGQVHSVNDLSTMQRIGGRLGIATGVSGAIRVVDGRFELQVEMLDLGVGETSLSTTFTGGIEELPGAIASVAMTVRKALDAPVDESYTSRAAGAASSSSDAIARLARVIALWQSENREAAATAAADLLADEPDLSAAALAYLQIPDFGHDNIEQNAFALSIAGSYPAHGAIQTHALRRLWPGSRFDVTRDKLQRLRDLVAADRDNWMAMVLLAAFLADNGYQRDAVSLARESVRRWPDNYRAWWSLAYALQKLAWYYRGSDFSANTPERSREQFAEMLAMADPAADRALELHPDVAGLWRLKMDLHPGYNAAMLAAYERALALAPNDYATYDYALNYAAPKWGGSFGAQIDIYEDAVENNPGVSWTNDLYAKHIGYETKLGIAAKLGCGPWCQQHIREMLLAVFLFLVALLGFIRYQRNRVPESLDVASYDQSNAGTRHPE
jgi:hypothetical protein